MKLPMADTPLFFLIAGEASGDLLGARLMQALKKKAPHARFAGVGGARMQAEGLELYFPAEELAHFGLIEVLRHLPQLLRRIRETAEEVKRRRPTALITIDAPDFNFRVARKLKKEGIPLIHYVAPTVWAWRPGRAAKIAKFLNHLLALLPFEPPYFTEVGLACSFVGHPVVESGAEEGDAARFRAAHSLAAETPLLVVLPGSRRSEVSRLMPVFREALERLRTRHSDLQVVIPAAPAVAAYVKEHSSTWPLPVILVEGDKAKYDAFAASRAALACSGTISLELALARVPAVIVYKVNPLTFKLARLLVHVKFANLVNIMHKSQIVPELIQDDCTPDRLAAVLDGLLSDEGARQRQIVGLADVAGWLGAGRFVPSERAAETVLDVVGRRSQSEAA
jgi:lipid-A-disaccharide synthase